MSACYVSFWIGPIASSSASSSSAPLDIPPWRQWRIDGRAPMAPPPKAAAKAEAKAEGSAPPPPAAKAEAKAEGSAPAPPATLPPQPVLVGGRVKAAPPPPRPPLVSGDSRSGDYDWVDGESTRERQWRLYGVWRKRAGKNVDWYNSHYKK